MNRITMSDPETQPPLPASFAAKVVEICRILERWRKQQLADRRPAASEFPDYNWRLAFQGFVFLGLGGVIILLQSWIKFVHDFLGLGIYMTLLAICEGAGLVLVFAATGILTGQFWRAVLGIFRKTHNYPFTTLIGEIEADAAASSLVLGYSQELLTAANQRILHEETELRERLTILGSGTPLPLILTLATGIWAGWKSYRDEKSFVTMIILGASIGVLWLISYSFMLRFELLELTRCRAFLDFEIARRQNDKEDGHSSA
jgi:hypothetical protein